MLSQVILIGRIVKEPELSDINGKKMTRIVLAIQRPFKNGETGEYDTDFIPVSLWQLCAEVAVENFTVGSVVCVKARLVTRTIQTGEEKSVQVVEVVGDRAFLISKKNNA